MCVFRKSKKVSKEKRKMKEKINMRMENPNDQHDIVGDNEVFSLAKIKTKKVWTNFLFLTAC